jgi:hypothetical protein
MPPLTLGQAAKASGRSKAGILKTIQTGRLSATRDDKGQWQIDPAELFRVYPATVQSEREGTPVNAEQTTVFQEKIGFLERIITGLEDERDDLRRRLDQSEDERRETQARLTALLTYQPAPVKAEAEPEPAPLPSPPPLAACGGFMTARPDCPGLPTVQ